VVLLVVPALLLACTKGFSLGWGLGLPWDAIAVCLGLALFGTGLYLLVMTILLFRNIGKGTLAPWSPPQKLVVVGPYRYVRNPMIAGVLIVVLGEAIIFGSVAIFILFVLFFIINHFYFIRSEEPGLVKRFGDDYIRYTKNVPRWLPRLSPWKNDNSRESAN
jgi:protein-S-isoprenylcysteine O-methyltransferase Ste14